MSLELRILSGARAGRRETFDAEKIAVGRHPLSDLQFDPELDRDVSTRHGEIHRRGNAWVLTDTNSTNGTYVNGARVTGERELKDGDVVAFGEHGPKVEVRLGSGSRHAVPDTRLGGPPGLPDAMAAAGMRASAAPVRPTAGAPPRGQPSTTERIAVAVREQTKTTRVALYGLAAVVVLGAVAAMTMWSRESKIRDESMKTLIARNDSLTREYGTLAGRLAGLDSAYREARERTERLQRELVTASSGRSGGRDVQELSAKLRDAQARQANIVSAAQMDYSQVQHASGAAIAMVVVELADGSAVTGTGFSVTPSGLLVTNKHVVEENGEPPKRVGAIFSDTKRWLPAHLVKVSPTEDLALVQVDAPATYPTVAGITRSASAVQVGSPIALIGFPLGVDLAMEGSGTTKITARSSLGVGTVSKMLPDVLQFDSFAGEGSSGTPIFDSRGSVVGVLFGGAKGSGGRIVYAVPSEKLIDFLPGDARGLVK